MKINNFQGDLINIPTRTKWTALNVSGVLKHACWHRISDVVIEIKIKYPCGTKCDSSEEEYECVFNPINITFCQTQINDFQGDLANMSANTKSLLQTSKALDEIQTLSVKSVFYAEPLQPF